METASAHPASLSPETLWEACDVERLRRSGPGGQHRNKVETAVRVAHRPTGVRAEASERRSQAANRNVALARLRINLALEIRRAWPVAGASLLWRSRCSGGRIGVSIRHADFPTLLAEALDAVQASCDDLGAAAALLGTTSSQLIRFLQKEPRAFSLLNDRRRQHGLRPVK
ncbi:MAG: peptide chain release factor family protein [Thermoguttaceae bacterium]